MSVWPGPRWTTGLGAGLGWGWRQGAECPAGLPPSGGDLHYHLSQHGVFSEADMRFYAAEIILGLEHMHSRFVVYRDLKVRCEGLSLLSHGSGVPWTGPAGSHCSLLPTEPFSGFRLIGGGWVGGGDQCLGPCPWTPVTL